MPPEVPATVNARVPFVIIGDPLTEIKPPVKDCATLVTVPAPAGVDQVPSPRQKVNADALVPELRFVTGKFPVTCVARLTPLNAPPSVKLPVLVTVPVRVIPLTVPVPLTLVTLPLPLLLNVLQSVELNAPRLDAEAVGT